MRLTKGPVLASLAAICSLCFAVTTARRVRADEAAPKSIIVFVEGDGAARIRAALVETLPGTPRIVDDDAVREALHKEKMMKPLSTILESPAKRKALLALMGAAMKATDASAAIVAHGKLAGRRRSAHVVVLERDKTELLVERDVALPGGGGPGDTQAEVKAMKDALGAPLQGLAPPPPAASTTPVVDKEDAAPLAAQAPVAPPPVATPAADHTDEHSIDRGRPLLVIAVEGELAGRFFEYHQPITQNLRSYKLPLTALVGAAAEVYPLARTHVPVLRDLGLIGSYARSLYIKSNPEGGGDSVSSAWTRFDAGLRFRYRVPAWRAPVLGVSASYGGFIFGYDAPATLAAQLPSVDNRFLRFGLDARVGFGRLSVFASGGYRLVLSAGILGDRFPREHVGGIDVGAGVAIGLLKNLEVRLFGDYTRTFYDFRPEPGDAHVAGGALDQLYGAHLALAFAF